ncbi:TatD family hydrolase [Chryseobacterium sp. A301]
MEFFDFHHHKEQEVGILNLIAFQKPVQRPFSVGMHPKTLQSDYTEEFQWIEKMGVDPNCWAIGEAGLDGLCSTPEDLQHKAFEAQIQLSNTLKKPMIIHCVRRFSMLLHFHKRATTPWIIHGFNKKETLAKELLDKGFYLSFGNALLHNVSLQTLFSKIPRDRFFLESDNSLSDIEEIYQRASSLRNVEVEELKKEIEDNLKSIRAHG